MCDDSDAFAVAWFHYQIHKDSITPIALWSVDPPG